MGKDKEEKRESRLSANAGYFVNFVSTFAIEGWSFSMESIKKVIVLAELESEGANIISRLVEFGVLEGGENDNKSRK